jgi:hypothetical protein
MAPTDTETKQTHKQTSKQTNKRPPFPPTKTKINKQKSRTIEINKNNNN